MRKIATISLVCLLSLSLWGCGDKEKAKGEEKKVEKQTEKTTRVTEYKEDKVVFNHAASIKMKDTLQNVRGMDNPIIVVHGKDAIIAYKANGNPREIEKAAHNKIKQHMPKYQLHFISDQDGYEKVKILSQDTIESEGRPIQNLSKHFYGLMKR